MATRSMSEEHAITIAFRVLAILKAALPQKMPRMDDDTQARVVAKIYADVISRTHLPARVFEEAALRIARTYTGDGQVTPALFRSEIQRANEELATDPDYRQVREQIRQKREQQRNERLGLTADGRTPELLALAGKVDQNAVEATKKRFRRKWADKPNKPARDANQSESDATNNDNTPNEPPTTPNKDAYT